MQQQEDDIELALLPLPNDVSSEDSAEEITVDLSDPLFQWLNWQIFSKHPPSKQQLYCDVSGVLVGAFGAAVNVNLGQLVGKLIAQSIHANPQGRLALEIILEISTALTRVPLGAIAAQDTLSDFRNYLQEPAHRPRKNNRPNARILAKTLSVISCGALGIMGIYIHMQNLQAPLPVQILFIPAVYFSNAQISQVVFDQYIDWSFDINSMGKKLAIKQQRAELRARLSKSIKAIYAMSFPEFEDFYDEIKDPNKTFQYKLNRLFSLEFDDITPEPDETWLHTTAGALGTLCGTLSAYSGTINLSYNMAEWYCQWAGIKNEEKEQTIALFLWFSTFTPYSVLLASSTKNAFKNLVKQYYGQNKPEAPIRKSNPELRKNLDRFATFIGPASALPNVWYALSATSFVEQALVITAISPALVYTNSIRKLFERGADYYASVANNSDEGEQKKFLAEIENLDTVIAQLPDEKVEALHKLVIKPSEAPLLTPLLITKTQTRGFFKKNTAEPTIWERIKSSCKI